MSRDVFEMSAGAYVLGALSPAERAAFVGHLDGCAGCRAHVDDMAGLPGLLSRVGPAGLTELDDGPVTDDDATPPLPASLLPDLLRAVDRRQRRRSWVTAAVVAVAACTALLAVLIGVQRTAAPTPLALRPVVNAPITADVGLTPVSWGTRIGLRCTYSGPKGVSRPYALVVLATDGRRESIGTWTAVPGDEVRLSGATSIRESDIAAVEVQALNGFTLLRLTDPGAVR